MIEINKDNVLELLRASIERHGGTEVVYKDRLVAQLREIGKTEEDIENTRTASDCFYVVPPLTGIGYDEPIPENAKPSCLIGCLLVDQGVDPVLFLRHSVNNSGVDELWSINELEQTVVMDPIAVEVLSVAQDTQDKGNPWGVAYERAQDALQLRLDIEARDRAYTQEIPDASA